MLLKTKTCSIVLSIVCLNILHVAKWPWSSLFELDRESCGPLVVKEITRPTLGLTRLKYQHRLGELVNYGDESLAKEDDFPGFTEQYMKNWPIAHTLHGTLLHILLARSPLIRLESSHH